MTKLTLRNVFAAAVLCACLPLIPHTAVAATPPAASLPDFADLVEKVGPAVVNIRTTANVPIPGPRGALPPGFDNGDMSEFFRRFFGIPLPQAPATAAATAIRRTGRRRTIRPTPSRTAASVRASSCRRTAT